MQVRKYDVDNSKKFFSNVVNIDKVEIIPPVARKGPLPEIMQTTSPSAQPDTSGHVTISHQATASLWGIPSSA